MTHTPRGKIVVGITIGDFNGIGVEVILKTLADPLIFDLCTPVIYGNSHVIAYHKKGLELEKFNYQIVKDGNFHALNPKTIGIVNCWEEEVILNMGQPSGKAGECALKALDAAMQDIRDNKIDAIITAPLNKSQVQLKEPTFTGHTEYITQKCGLTESVMLLTSEELRVGLVTNHLPLAKVPAEITQKKIITKLEILDRTLKKDFGINGPKIAVLGLNPHAGDSGALGKEEKEIIIPTIEKAQENGILAYGPYPADGLMGSGNYRQFDAILAMYHDQGLVAFKSIAFGSGVNYTAGLPIVRTSPDHGTAYDIAGKNLASPDSFRQALFLALDVCRNRHDYEEYTKNPLKRSKMSVE